LLRAADLIKPELVQRDQNVTLVFSTTGVHLTIAGKAVESGSAGDVISVMNLQSKRMIQGTVIGPGQVRVASAASRLTTASLPVQPTASRRNVE
jgi:flagellar basal body P-ring formation protein FlgA